MGEADADRSGTVTAAEATAWATRYLASVAIRVDGVALGAALRGPVTFPGSRTSFVAGTDSIIAFTATSGRRLQAGIHSVQLAGGAYPDISSYSLAVAPSQGLAATAGDATATTSAWKLTVGPEFATGPALVSAAAAQTQLAQRIGTSALLGRLHAGA